MGNEDNVHFVLHCPMYDSLLSDIFNQLADVPGLNIACKDTKELFELLFYGDPKLNLAANRILI